MNNVTRWLPVVEYEGLYEVSEDGRVRKMFSSHRGKAGTELVSHLTTGGYYAVTLRKNATYKFKTVHRLVAQAFLPAPIGAVEVLHTDGDARHNNVSNLRWGSHSENELDKVAHGNHNMARKTHCPQGHEYSASNTSIDSDGKRRCRICRRAKSLARYYRLK